MAFVDLETDNNNNLVIKNNDINYIVREGAKLIALRNYLNANKLFITQNLSVIAIEQFILNKALDLNLNAENLNFSASNIKKGSIYITLTAKLLER